jgi:hypothetical protein
MTLTRITSILGAVALGGVLVASTYGAQAARPPAPDRSAHAHHGRAVHEVDHFHPPMLHRYGKNGLRMGLHCETSAIS